MIKYILFLIILNTLSCSPSCEEGLNHCSNCNPITKLCIKCDLDVFIPDENGGCSNSKKCKSGTNYCLDCNEEENLCKTCDDGYYPDENGGCSYINNCQLSYRGKCLECKDDYIFVGKSDSFQICKSLNSEDLKNCEKINLERGSCEKCKEGYFLNIGDKKCTKTEHCYESQFGLCQLCSRYYYLNKKEDKCISSQEENFYNCRESLDGESCDVCNENYYLSKDKKCVNTNYCEEAGNYKCNKCISGYYLSEEDNICTKEKNCLYGKEDFGICLECKDGYALDFKDGKCKSNEEDNELKYCKFADGDCKECLKHYYLGEDNKCSFSKNCSESENGICLECVDNYYLGKDNKCTNVKHCIYSDDYFKCEECEGKYCYNEDENKCFIGEGELENCKFSYFGSWCSKCKDDFYLNQTEFLCRSNSDPDDYFYKCAKTHSGIDMCSDCVKGYYLGYKDHKCSKIDGCLRSENENKCLECNEYHCLDAKTGNCEINFRIENEKKKFYYRCNKTNEEGTACEICLDGYTLSEDGLCVDDIHCEEKDEDDICLKCLDDDNRSYCLNKDFGCVHTFYGNCLECDDLLNLDECTKCDEGFKINDYGKCV